MKRITLARLLVRPIPGDPRHGRLITAAGVIPCALGRSGVTRRKREGDGATPVGRFRLIGLGWRGDRLARPRTLLAARPLAPRDGWCDDPGDPRYNRPLGLPSRAGHERLWRDDHLYDVVIDIGYNRGPIRRGHGSAIFLHLAKPGFAPTEGCVAVERRALIRLLPRLGPRTRIVIAG